MGPPAHSATGAGSDTSSGGSASRQRFTSQPATARQGITEAVSSITRGVQRAAHTIITIPIKEYKRNGTQVCTARVHVNVLLLIGYIAVDLSTDTKATAGG